MSPSPIIGYSPLIQGSPLMHPLASPSPIMLNYQPYNVIQAPMMPTITMVQMSPTPDEESNSVNRVVTTQQNEVPPGRKKPAVKPLNLASIKN